jgi:hypothetical protein
MQEHFGNVSNEVSSQITNMVMQEQETGNTYMMKGKNYISRKKHRESTDSVNG